MVPIATLPEANPAAQINRVAAHPKEPVLVTAHEDKRLQFYDLSTGACASRCLNVDTTAMTYVCSSSFADVVSKPTGKCNHTMVAHQDAVACVAIHPNGQTAVTAGHDSSLRAWDMRTYACVQETATHRPKYQEAVMGLAIHSSGTLLATGGGDSIVRLYTQ